MKNNLLILLLFFFTAAQAQLLVDFEEYDLMEGEFLNQVEGDTFFTGNISLVNNYNENYDSWLGWAISATTDVTTPGFGNQFSSISGGGANGSSTYAVTYAFDPTSINLTGDAAGEPVAGIYVNNGTYAYLSMLNGGDPAKRFGGEDGNDPDFFLLTIQAELDGVMSEEVVEFYLADYRFEDNSEDYIVTDWTYINLESLGNADRIWLSLSSSDSGMFGMNTPAYICVDDITTAGDPVRTRNEQVDYDLQVFPNPTVDRIQISWPLDEQVILNVLQANGKLVTRQTLSTGTNEVSLQYLPAGTYYLQVQTTEGWDVQQVIKL